MAKKKKAQSRRTTTSTTMTTRRFPTTLDRVLGLKPGEHNRAQARRVRRQMDQKAGTRTTTPTTTKEKSSGYYNDRKFILGDYAWSTKGKAQGTSRAKTKTVLPPKKKKKKPARPRKTPKSRPRNRA